MSSSQVPLDLQPGAHRSRKSCQRPLGSSLGEQFSAGAARLRTRRTVAAAAIFPPRIGDAAPAFVGLRKTTRDPVHRTVPVLQLFLLWHRTGPFTLFVLSRRQPPGSSFRTSARCPVGTGVEWISTRQRTLARWPCRPRAWVWPTFFCCVFGHHARGQSDPGVGCILPQELSLARHVWPEREKSPVGASPFYRPSVVYCLPGLSLLTPAVATLHRGERLDCGL